MTLPSWVESVTGLIGKLVGNPVSVSKRAKLQAEYLAVSFATAVLQVCKLGIAQPLSELRDSKLQKIKSIDIADAAMAHNKALVHRIKGEAESEKIRAEAEKLRARARQIDGSLELARIAEQRKLAQAKAIEARARLEAATMRLRIQGGDLYLEQPSDESDIV